MEGARGHLPCGDPGFVCDGRRGLPLLSHRLGVHVPPPTLSQAQSSQAPACTPGPRIPSLRQGLPIASLQSSSETLRPRKDLILYAS